ncbi:MAG: cell division protein FtsQ [Comamonas sp. SCN 67-35]|uniref:cell division protein FtsQ/DivIB n=1 Tax=unclassified Comamonas TaxID=2638500 RepID=UPI00086A0866|nr:MULTISPECIES: cell division protein FtsQ/DivIB [unclassified Comamonas]MBN9329631.1 cell division protein FtsQ/DivIB [Comamonas sp.]ODU37773.1 MAG: cell division protein FtsQ [Comamonas sp. SCN 67-35]OJX02974.1 MAG: cell division protein FtsQ [Burkholderiales bacterium 66-26]
MSEALRLPVDVRLMNWTTAVLLLGCAVAFMLVLGSWMSRLPLFALTKVTVDGELARVDTVALRTKVTPVLVGNFFTMDLQAVRRAFEQVPWVRSVQVQREFPHALRVRVREQDAAALWGEADSGTLVNREGEVFEADPAALEDERLARLVGPREQSAPMLAMLGQLAPALEPLQRPVESLALSAHGSWRVQLENGAALELGTGEAPVLLARLKRLTDTLAGVAQRQGRRVTQLEYADLRYANGYALRLQGVSTVSSDTPHPAAARRPAPTNHRG